MNVCLRVGFFGFYLESSQSLGTPVGIYMGEWGGVGQPEKQPVICLSAY